MLFKDHYQKQLKDEIKKCSQCSLCKNPGPVHGYGGLNAEVMFIADCPDEKEARAGIPFIGHAKNLMLHAINANELKKGGYYFTYLVKHHKGNIENIEDSHISRCSKILLEEIELINPRIIVSMGFYVTKFMIQHFKIEDAMGAKMHEVIGNSMIIPSAYKRKKLIRPKRYLIPTFSPCEDDEMKNISFKEDITMIKSLRSMWMFLNE